MGVPCSDDVMLNYQSTSFMMRWPFRAVQKSAPGAGVPGLAPEMGLYKGATARIEASTRKQLAAGLEKAMK